MAPTTTPAVTGCDPLMTAADRFPQARSRFSPPEPDPHDRPSAPGVRPFGLRFAVRMPGKALPVPPWRYCPDRQIAVTEDGRPWRELVDMTMDTTGYSTDGTGSTGGEEYTPDYTADTAT